MITFQATGYTTSDGKQVLTFNPDYHSENLDETTDAAGRFWTLRSTTYENKTKLRWICEDSTKRLSLPGTMPKADVESLDDDIKGSKQSTVKQSASIKLVLD